MRQAVWPLLLRHVLLEFDMVEFLLRVLLRGGHLRRHLRRTQVLGGDCPFPYVCGTLCVRVCVCVCVCAGVCLSIHVCMHA
jgi:hypothetical protein